MQKLLALKKSTEISLYRVENKSAVNTFIASTTETRDICNNPLTFGVEYTRKLRNACAKTIKALKETENFTAKEIDSSVYNILRGGLNFELREALNQALNWNRHSSSFISSQRERIISNSEEWQVVESHYQKIYLNNPATIIFGDVVATGTSLKFSINEILKVIERDRISLSEIIFFTIGGIRAEEILLEVDKECRKKFSDYRGSSVIFFEGQFKVADLESPVSIKFTGTDFLRRESLLAPEFLKSHLENPCYPLERCSIYDAGSRSFHISEYLEDVINYWNETLTLAKNGMSYQELLAERFPELLPEIAEINTDLQALCLSQLQKLKLSSSNN